MVAFSYNQGVYNLAIQPKLTDVQGNDLYPMLNRIPKYSKNTTQIKWNADTGGAATVGESILALGTTDTGPGSVKPAVLPIAENRLRYTFSVLTPKMAEAEAAGEGPLANLLAFSARDGIRKLLRDIARLIYTGTGVAADAGVIGLNGIVSTVVAGKTTSPYANIDPATSPGWTNYVNTSGTNRALTVDLMYKMSEEIYGGGTLGLTSNFTAIYINPKMATKYKLLFQSFSMTQVGTNAVADVGYSGMSYEGRPIFMDPYCPENVLYFVDESEMGLYSFVEGEFAFGDEQSADGINFKIVQMPQTNPDAVQFAIVTKPQVQLVRRPALAVLGAIVN